MADLEENLRYNLAILDEELRNDNYKYEENTWNKTGQKTDWTGRIFRIMRAVIEENGKLVKEIN